MMNQVRKIGSAVVLFCLSLASQAQETIRGRVLDRSTGKPVSFASVVSPSQNRGTTANVDGNFSFTVKSPGEKLNISSIGYEKLVWTSTSGMNEILLRPSSANMQAIVIKPNDEQDPRALEIIRKTIANKKNNDPEELSSFSYNSYSKGVVDTVRKDIAKRSKNTIIGSSVDKDTGRYQFMVESVFEHKYKKPGLHSNRMTAQRVSGLRNPFIIGLVTQLQYFSFYKDDFSLLRSNYRNPVSSKYFRQYVFSLVDSIRGQDDQQIYIISFRPRYKSLGLGLLKGQVHIHGMDWAIVNVEASAYLSSSTSSISFRQNYEQAGTQWFPKQLQTQLMFLPDDQGDDGGEEGGAVKFNVTSYLKDIEINPELKRSAFGNYEIVVDEMSGKRSDAYWEQRREKPLDMSEIRTFRHLDSVMSARKDFRKAELRADALGYLISGKIPVGNLNIDLREIIKLNEFETVRLGFGMSTNERFSEHHKIGASFGYGFRDDAWKYGAFYEYKPSKDSEFTLGVSYRKDIALWGLSNLLLPGIRIRNYQYLLTDRADDLRKLELYSKFRLLKKVDAMAFVNWQERGFNHNYSYAFATDPFKTFRDPGVIEGGFRLSTRFKQPKLKYGSLQLTGFRTDDPRLAIDIRYGMSVDDAQGLRYLRVEGLYESVLKLGRIGKLNYNISAGYISGETPYSMLFNNLGTNRRAFDLFVPATFSSMQPFQFTNTAYAALFTEFESGYIFQRRKKWGISLFIPNSVGIGSYDQDMIHYNVSVSPMNNLYAETGLGLKYRTRKRTIGFSTVYRYGFYAAPKFGDNLFFRVLVDR